MPKKSLGQNFLKSSLALKKIIEAGEIKSTDVILEIGPGRGVLTKKLLEHAGKVIAVEKDNQLFELLQEKFAEQIASGSLVLVHDDILKFDIVRQSLTSYKVVANIPYNITGAILKKFLTEKNQPECMVLMVQHEVAKRIMGRSKNPSTPLRVKESLLSISVKAYGEPKMIMKVPARYFSPAPKVDSAVIAIKNISRKLFTLPPPPLAPPPSQGGGSVEVQGRTLNSLEFEARFWKIVRAGFAHKRKKLSSNLKSTLSKNGSCLRELGNKRAEDLSLSNWITLAKN